MPNFAKGPHLKLRKQAGAKPIYYIIDNDRRISTGCTAKQTAKANEILETHKQLLRPEARRGFLHHASARPLSTRRCANHTCPKTPSAIWTDSQNSFGDGVQRHHTSRDPLLSEMRTHVGKASINEPPRTRRPVSPETVRRELATLRRRSVTRGKMASSSIRLR